jgi:8-oxo-dGDP phosphatase
MDAIPMCNNIYFAVAKGVVPAAPSDYIPILNKNICYIVAAVLLNESQEVLMMQEAKRSCAGQWYLPAGHIEIGETIQQAVEREVKMLVLF